jgi:hypothetical protein
MAVRAQRKGDVKKEEKKKNVIGRMPRRVRADVGNGR